MRFVKVSFFSSALQCMPSSRIYDLGPVELNGYECLWIIMSFVLVTLARIELLPSFSFLLSGH
jgi:hypothetical protein